ncbi:MAG: hypothetical protein OXI45_03740 [Acidobacteriota bacterium]|nr:hypothetical protein [Acidobacteriota bacterium]MDE2710876.1 hypothetical protein [Acidobacteriota bacterium]
MTNGPRRAEAALPARTFGVGNPAGQAAVPDPPDEEGGPRP